MDQSFGCKGAWAENSEHCHRCKVLRRDHWVPIQPGTYRATKTIDPLKPDRRKSRDWRALPINKGDFFCVRDERHLYGKIMIAKQYAYSHICFAVTDSCVKPLLEILEYVEEQSSDWLERFERISYAPEILDALVTAGKICMYDVMQTLESLQQKERRPAPSDTEKAE